MTTLRDPCLPPAGTICLLLEAHVTMVVPPEDSSFLKVRGAMSHTLIMTSPPQGGHTRAGILGGLLAFCLSRGLAGLGKNAAWDTLILIQLGSS